MANRLVLPSNVDTSDANGDIILTFPTPSQGTAWTGVIVLPATVNDAAIWEVTAAGIFFGAFNGKGPYGPITIISNEVLTLTGSSLTPNSEFNATFIGYEQPQLPGGQGGDSSNTFVTNSFPSSTTVANPVDQQGDMTFVFAGELSVAQWPLWTSKVSRSAQRIVGLLGTAGTTPTTFEIHFLGGPTIWTFTMLAGVTSWIDNIVPPVPIVGASATAIGDKLQAQLTAAGTGAKNFSCFIWF